MGASYFLMTKRALISKKAVVLPPSSDSSDVSEDGPNSMSEFQVLIGALQSKFNKKAKDQQGRFETELKNVVERTVELLSAKVNDYETHLSEQLNMLEKELGKISKERESQVAEFEKQYSGMKKTVEVCLCELEKLDDQYNDQIKGFFQTINAYRASCGQSRETIAKLAEEIRAEPSTNVNSKRRRK